MLAKNSTMVTRNNPFGNSKCIKSLKPLISKFKKFSRDSVQVLSQWHEP